MAVQNSSQIANALTRNVSEVELADILAKSQALKEDRENSVALSYFDSSIVVSQIVAKIPQNIQEKWANEVFAYKKSESVAFSQLFRGL